MKKFKNIFVIFLICFTIILCSCNNKINEIIQNKISEVRFNLFNVYTDEINVDFTSGFREEPYILNGKSENKKEFGVVTITFLKEIEDKNTLPSFVITINDMDFDGELELNPFDQTYVQDIETFVLDDANISIKVMWNDYLFESNLKNISKNFNLNHSKALNIFIKDYKKEIKNIIKNDIDFEVYIKILNDSNFIENKRYFYVCLITNNGESLSMIIDPFSQEILAKNRSRNQVIL